MPTPLSELRLPARRLRAGRLALLLSVLVAASASQAQTPADSLGGPAHSGVARPDAPAAPSAAPTDPLTGEAETAAPPPGSFDARLVRAVYRIDAPTFVGVMRGANESAYPVFAAAAPVAAGVALARGGSVRPAVRLAASEVGALGAAFLLKRVFRRPRPYRAVEGVRARDRGHTGDAPFDPASFPSGHAAASFAIATSVTLSDGRLAAPALAWATAVSVARVWHGVHYPSDVLAGAVLGAGSATVVHLLSPVVFGRDEADGRAASFRIVVAL